MSSVDDGVDALFTVAPEDFISARDALAKRLRNEKQRDQAATVAKLRRPGPVVWAINQVARAKPALVEELLRTGAAALAAQSDVLNGRPVEGLHASVELRRAVITQLVREAGEVLAAHGTALDPLVPQLRSGLEALSVDETSAAALRTGTLVALPSVGDGLVLFGVVASNTSAPALRHLRLVPPPVEREHPHPTPDPVLAEAARREQEQLTAARTAARHAAEAAHRTDAEQLTAARRQLADSTVAFAAAESRAQVASVAVDEIRGRIAGLEAELMTRIGALDAAKADAAARAMARDAAKANHGAAIERAEASSTELARLGGAPQDVDTGVSETP